MSWKTEEEEAGQALSANRELETGATSSRHPGESPNSGDKDENSQHLD